MSLPTDIEPCDFTREYVESALSELYALVKGECPSLLNEDSGGDWYLDLKIREILGLP